MRLKVLDIRDVAEGHLCTGCGVCAYLDPDGVEMIDDLHAGRRPLAKREPAGEDAQDAFRACPGAHLEHSFDERAPDLIAELRAGWGPVLGVWEGFATDDDIRFSGSSGGAASALALFGIERESMHGLLHIDSRDDVPFLNKTVLSTSRQQILGATGSRYAPASPCDGLAEVERAPSPCVMIGKPCDIAGARAAARLRPALDEKLGITIAIFCAGTPSTEGTLEMIRSLGIEDPGSVTSVRYRGNGWPGRATVEFRAPSGAIESRSLTYHESWGEILQRHRQWRCYICPDHTGEFADIAVGDPWYREVPEGAIGQSLIVARTERGKAFIERAIEAGFLEAGHVDPDLLPQSQPNLLALRGSLWGRMLVLRALGAGVPQFRGLPVFRFWLSRLTLKKKGQSIVGTAKRVFRKRLRERREVRPYDPAPESRSASGGDAA